MWDAERDTLVVPDEWIVVAVAEPSGNPRADRQTVLDRLEAFLDDRGIVRGDVVDADIRIDLIYMGPERGQCATRLLVRRASLDVR